MRKCLALIAAAVLSCARIASAQEAVLEQPYAICTIAGSAATNCRTGRGFIIGFENISVSAQTATISCTDSGVTIKAIAALGASQVINYPQPGTPFFGNAVCTPSAAITGAVFMYYRPQ